MTSSWLVVEDGFALGEHLGLDVGELFGERVDLVLVLPADRVEFRAIDVNRYLKGD